VRPRWARRALALLVVCVMSLSITPSRAAADANLADLVFINADNANDVGYLAICGRYWPTDNIFETKVEGNIYTAKWRFRFVDNEVNALKCIKTTSFPAANFVEADFRLLGFQGADGWENYSLYSSNLPGATHDVAFGDSGNSATPGASAIDVDALSVNVWYDLQVSWDINGGMAPIAGQTPRVSFELVPSHWAMTTDPNESLCLPVYAATQNKAWCVFGNTRAYVSHGYRNNVSVPFSGNQSFTYPQASPPPPSPMLYHGPVPDGMVVQSTNSNLYVAAGGRLFRFDKNNAGMLSAFRAQMQQKYGSTIYLPMAAAEVHAVEVNRTSAGVYSPGTNMPADNTFMYEYGTTQQYVIKYQHPFAVGDSNEVIALGGQDKAIMVPPGLADLQAHPAQWVQDDLLRFGTDPSVWHYAGDKGFRVPGVPTRDCLMLQHNRGVTYMPASAWNYFPTHPTQQAACDFADDQWLFGTPSNRQMVVMYGAGYNVGSAEEVIALGGQNKAVPVADETVTGLLARTGSLPNDELVKSYNSPHVYHVVDNKLHYVGSPATRDCLSARSGKTVRTVPIDLIGRMQANGQTGANAYCELENRQLLGPNGTSVVYIKDGYKRPVGNPAIRDCIAVRTGAGQPLAVSDNVWNSYTVGANAYCPYETELGLNFVQEAGDPTVWLVHAPSAPGQPGTKQHVGSLCVPDPYTTQLKKYHVWTVPVGETAGHVQSADFWASGALCGALPG